MRPLEILVVDDHGGICDALKAGLSHLGHRVTCARDGAVATELVRQQVFDVVVTDILMPVGDGLELIGELRRSQPNVRIVAISGGGRLSYHHYLDAARALGAHAVLAKPFSLSELNSVLIRISESTEQLA